MPPKPPNLLNDKRQLPLGEHVKLLRKMAKQLPKADMEAEIEAAHEVLTAKGVPEAEATSSGALTLLTLSQRIQALGT